MTAPTRTTPSVPETPEADDVPHTTTPPHQTVTLPDFDPPVAQGPVTLPDFGAPEPEPESKEEPEEPERQVTPSGIEIIHRREPHMYMVRPPGAEKPKRWVSVTSITKVLDKPLLLGWVERVTCEAVAELAEHPAFQTVDPEALRNLIHGTELDHKSVRERASDRGDFAHKVMEALFGGGELPSTDGEPEEHLAYAEGIRRFHEDIADSIEVLGVEMIVASPEHEFVGRLDLLIKVLRPVRLCFDAGELDTTGVLDPESVKYDWVNPGIYVVDAKSAKAVYPLENFRQLAGYKLAARTSGYANADGGLLVRVNPEGRYEVATSTATEQEFLTLLTVYRDNQKILKAHSTNRKKLRAEGESLFDPPAGREAAMPESERAA